jgi:hypothetical protein
MATQNGQPSHVSNNHGYPKPATTINPKPKMHSEPTPKSHPRQQPPQPQIANHHTHPKHEPTYRKPPQPQTTTPIQNTNPHIANHHNHKPQTTTPTQNTNPHIANHHTNKKPPSQQPSQPITTSQQTHFAQTQAKELLLGLTCKTNVFFFAIREVSDLGDYFDRVVCGVVSLTAECGLEDGFGFSSGPGGFDLL